jgi:hypothetical protein
MRPFVQYREKAITLRKMGYSYSEIHRELPVSKGSLHNWLKSIPLDEKHIERIKDRRVNGRRLGLAMALKVKGHGKLHDPEKVQKEAQKEFDVFQSDHFFNVGLSLYWSYRSPSSYFQCTTSDSDAARILIKWMRKYLKLSDTEIFVKVYMHKRYDDGKSSLFWPYFIGLAKSSFEKPVYLKDPKKAPKQTIYKGYLRIRVKDKKAKIKADTWQRLLIRYYSGNLS